ncbi:SAM-dependent DNA methyltransferase [Rhizobium leguminosarum]|uniref:SAM-dependent methyltransferase n=1 Tax=Rhizobium leguminosarum TaxID=384 RepID=UPI001C95949C|nr:SAM-dependent methyltransferase [Rhizobium leguminosarum]MBY5603253.1 SAM-dependent DNA methyltransferase [Rhizobium leguminosarum]
MSNRHLSVTLRGDLRKAVEKGRIVAEEGARDAIRRLGVAEGKAPSYLSDVERELRRRLRAHARALGDAFDRADETQEAKRVVEAAAYAHWHRMLFARFLAERRLLRNPDYDVPVTLEDCRELAEAEGLTDAWAVAERYAAAMLPAVFRTDDPVLALELDPAHTQTLHRLVTALDGEVFQAEDSLGWTYQFWRAAEKKAVNDSGVKIGADELPAVTQLFTEPYMVRFMLHNTLGAWWAGKVLNADPMLAETAADEKALRAACSLPDYSFDMLRFVRDGEVGPWRPAAGTFRGWPKDAKAITMLDPCCGSGHFLTESMAVLAALRRAEEGLPSADAVAAVLRENLHGLEIDGRCVQIAAFAVALAAWRIGGWQTLPLPHIAWVGAPPPLPKREFVTLADGDAELEYALIALHDMFAQAPLLGSLLEPSGGDLFETEKMREIERLLEPLLVKARLAEPEHAEGVVAARGMADAALLLHKRYTLQLTNVPFLGRGKQEPALSEYIDRRFGNARADLSTAMIARMQLLSDPLGTIAIVSPQNWYVLDGYKEFRRALLTKTSINIVCDLGPAAFRDMNWWAARTALTITSAEHPSKHTIGVGISLAEHRDTDAKSSLLLEIKGQIIPQEDQFKNPDSRIVTQRISTDNLLLGSCSSRQGIKTGDDARFRCSHWEIQGQHQSWNYFQGTPDKTMEYSGCTDLIFWKNRGQDLARLQGIQSHGSLGCAIGQMNQLPSAIYLGTPYDSNMTALVPEDEALLPALWAYVSSDEFRKNVRKIEPGVKVNNATFLKVSFDHEAWSEISQQKFGGHIPEPYSTDPTQWLFHGHPANADKGTALHVAFARLCGYRWPAETDTDMRLSDKARSWIAKAAALPDGDNDGLLGVPAVAGEKALADRLRAYLAAAFGAEWSDAMERRLITEADDVLDKKTARDGSLEAWLRDRAFRQHSAVFGQRPFLWHISDGLKDGFSVFVHYHRFDQAALRKLTYTMLGDWLARAKAENNALRYETGRELQQMLERVLEGEKPYDIFVRWKSLAQQPLGWDPDPDDGVRQNIRPFIEAGVLTHDLSRILKEKDRGTDVTFAPWYPIFKGERRNDHYTTLAEKRAAREVAIRRVEAAK